MAESDMSENVCCVVSSTAHAMKRALDTELAQEGITFRQWEVLACLKRKGAQSQNELAEKLGIEAPTLAGIVSRMERDGWLERTCCEDDRRRKRIRTTPRADAVWDRCEACCHRIRETATADVSPEELEHLQRICEKMRANLTAAAEAALLATE